MFIVVHSFSHFHSSMYGDAHRVHAQLMGVYRCLDDAVVRAIGHHPEAREIRHSGQCVAAWSVECPHCSAERAVFQVPDEGACDVELVSHFMGFVSDY